MQHRQVYRAESIEKGLYAEGGGEVGDILSLPDLRTFQGPQYAKRSQVATNYPSGYNGK